MPSAQGQERRHRFGRLPVQFPVGATRFSVAHFLGALVLMLVTLPFVEEWRWGRIVESGLLTVVMLSAVLAVGGTRRTLTWATVLVAPALAGHWVEHLVPGGIPDGLPIAAGVVFLGFVLFHLMRFIYRAPRVDREVMCAGVAGYMMLAIVWAMAFLLTDRLVPGSFSVVGTTGVQEFRGFKAFYLSAITLTTVGYGDIVPVSNIARMLAMMEAMTGTFYVALLVARLVSAYSRGPAPGAGSGGSDGSN